jgi:hypothetical protein
MKEAQKEGIKKRVSQWGNCICIIPMNKSKSDPRFVMTIYARYPTIKLFMAAINYLSYTARMFVALSRCHPFLIFASRARSLFLKWAPLKVSIWVGLYTLCHF